MYVCVYIYIYICVYLSLSLSLFIYLCIHIYNIYIHIQIYIVLFSSLQAGCTRLADGISIASTLQRLSPAAFDFFTETHLPFIHKAGEAHFRARAPVLTLDRSTGVLSDIRYNETDRDVFDCLSAGGATRC